MLDERALSSIWCPERQYFKPLICCLTCQRYPCRGFTDEWQEVLERSPFVQISSDSKLVARRIKTVYEFVMADGSKRDAPPDFDPNNPKLEEIRDVVSVRVITKELVPQIRFVPKPSSEVSAIRAAAKREVPDPTEATAEPPKKRRSRKAN